MSRRWDQQLPTVELTLTAIGLALFGLGRWLWPKKTASLPGG